MRSNLAERHSTVVQPLHFSRSEARRSRLGGNGEVGTGGRRHGRGNGMERWRAGWLCLVSPEPRVREWLWVRGVDFVVDVIW